MLESKEKLIFFSSLPTVVNTYCLTYVEEEIKCFTWIFRSFNFFFLSVSLSISTLPDLPDFQKNVFLPFPSLGEGGGCKKILREIFSLELPVTGGRGRFYKVIYKFV